MGEQVALEGFGLLLQHRVIGRIFVVRQRLGTVVIVAPRVCIHPPQEVEPRIRHAVQRIATDRRRRLARFDVVVMTGVGEQFVDDGKFGSQPFGHFCVVL